MASFRYNWIELNCCCCCWFVRSTEMNSMNETKTKNRNRAKKYRGRRDSYRKRSLNGEARKRSRQISHQLIDRWNEENGGVASIEIKTMIFSFTLSFSSLKSTEIYLRYKCTSTVAKWVNDWLFGLLYSLLLLICFISIFPCFASLFSLMSHILISTVDLNEWFHSVVVVVVVADEMNLWTEIPSIHIE